MAGEEDRAREELGEDGKGEIEEVHRGSGKMAGGEAGKRMEQGCAWRGWWRGGPEAAAAAVAWGRRCREEGSVVRRVGGGYGGGGMMACGGDGDGGGGGGNGDVFVVGARNGGGSGSDDGNDTDACGGGGWTPSPAFREQPLKREETSFFFSQMTARVCEGIPSPLIEPKMAKRGKGPLETHDPKPKHTHRNKKVHKEEGLHE